MLQNKLDDNTITEEPLMPARRWRRLKISPELLLRLLLPSKTRIYSIEDIPPSCRLVRVARTTPHFYDIETDSFTLIIEDESFDEVLEGNIIPELYPLIRMVVVEESDAGSSDKTA